MRTMLQPLHIAKLAAVWLAVTGASVLSGALVAGRVDTWLGQTFSLLLLAAVVGAAFFMIFAQLGSSAVVVWPLGAVIGYAIVELPRSHPIITFDRIWIGGMLAYIAFGRSLLARAPASRLLFFSMIWLGVSFGVRSFVTSAGTTGPVAIWIDAIILPIILFVACERFSVSRERLQRLAASLMVAGGILGGIGIAERIWGFQLATLTGGSIRFDAAVDQTRVSGPYPAPEPYALALIICLAATLYWIQARGRGAYMWGLIFAALEVGGITLSLFRAAWLGAIVMAIASFGIRPRRYGRLFAVVGLALALALAATSQLEQNKTFSTRTRNTDNIYGRLATYEQGIQIFRGAPLFGVGVDQYKAVAEKRTPVAVSNVESVTFPHSSYIGLLAEQGLVGFLPFLFVSFAVWRVIRALGRVSTTDEVGVLTGTLAGAAIGYLIMSLTLTMLPYEPSNAFFAALLGAACGRLDSLSSDEQRHLR